MSERITSYAKYNAPDMVIGLLPDPDPRSTRLVDAEDVAVVPERRAGLEEVPDLPGTAR